MCLVSEREGGMLPVGDVPCVICSICCANEVQATTLSEVRGLRSSQMTQFVRYMVNSIMTPHTEESETMMLCGHDTKHRISVSEVVPSILLYFTKNELQQTAIWLLKVVLGNLLLKPLLDPRVSALSDINAVCGDDCPRSAMLTDILLRST